LDSLEFLHDHASSIWTVFAAAMSGFAASLLSLRNISATVERTRIAMKVEIMNAEASERSAFRSALMTEVAEMRSLSGILCEGSY
jgi:hypothetical protein